LHALVKQTGESAAYHVRQESARLCLYRVDSPHPIRDHVRAGEVLPLYRGSGGRVLVAFDETLWQSVPDVDKALYRRIAAQGFYAAMGDRLAEVAGISAPVFGPDKHITGALTLTMPVYRYKDEYIAQLVSAATELSAQLPGP
jgi:DNA-binding IclR family transcriptional regulator